MKERIIVEFDYWEQDVSIQEELTIRKAVRSGDYHEIAKILDISNADDIRIERSVERWETTE